MSPSPKSPRRRNLLVVPPEVAAQLQGSVVNTARGADILRISRSEFKRRVRKGIIPVVRDARGRGWFSEQQLRSVVDASPGTGSQSAPNRLVGARRRPGSEFVGSSVSGTVARRVFKLLELKKRPVEIVIATGIAPVEVEAAAEAYYRIRRQVVLSLTERYELEQFLQTRLIGPPGELLPRLREAFDRIRAEFAAVQSAAAAAEIARRASRENELRLAVELSQCQRELVAANAAVIALRAPKPSPA